MRRRSSKLYPTLLEIFRMVKALGNRNSRSMVVHLRHLGVDHSEMDQHCELQLLLLTHDG